MRWGRPDPATGEWYVTGEPIPGTSGAVGAIDGGHAGSPAALKAVDPAFDADAFVAWSQTVYDRAVAAWRVRSPEPLRPVMAAEVWDAYAKHLLFVSTLPLMASVMAAARGQAAWAGAGVGDGYQSVLVHFDVGTDASVFAALKVPDDHRTWQERWLFQRPESDRTYASGAVAVCPVCGAPAQPEETGRCRYCHADITSRTAGWLVTRTETTNPGMTRMDDRLAAMRSKSDEHPPLPPPPVVAPPAQPPRSGPT